MTRDEHLIDLYIRSSIEEEQNRGGDPRLAPTSIYKGLGWLGALTESIGNTIYLERLEPAHTFDTRASDRIERRLARYRLTVYLFAVLAWTLHFAFFFLSVRSSSTNDAVESGGELVLLVVGLAITQLAATFFAFWAVWSAVGRRFDVFPVQFRPVAGLAWSSPGVRRLLVYLGSGCIAALLLFASLVILSNIMPEALTVEEGGSTTRYPARGPAAWTALLTGGSLVGLALWAYRGLSIREPQLGSQSLKKYARQTVRTRAALAFLFGFVAGLALMLPSVAVTGSIRDAAYPGGLQAISLGIGFGSVFALGAAAMIYRFRVVQRELRRLDRFPGPDLTSFLEYLVERDAPLMVRVGQGFRFVHPSFGTFARETWASWEAS